MLETRLMTEAERSYVIATWLRSFWTTARGHEFKGRPEAYYLRTYDGRIKEALASGTRVEVAVDPEFPAVVVGWVAHTGTTLHYLYVRAPLRRQGVARALLDAVAGGGSELWAHSHQTPDLARLIAGSVLKTVYRPQHFHEPERKTA